MFYQIAIVLCCMQFKQVVGNHSYVGGQVCMGHLGCGHGLIVHGWGDPYEAFLGIPYAYPPTGKRRFKNPEMYNTSPLNDYNDYSAQKEDCAQKNYLTPNHEIRGSEDCLYLNVYRPQNITGKLPVIVFIHGGGFFSGTANRSVYGPEFFMAKGEVIFVTFTYRLGPFGFLSTCDYNIQGNFGLKDQNMALQFIQKYISDFDGDPNQVTIFGHGAGGASVHLHMLSPLSRGLFHRAISMSGSAAAPFADLIRDPLEQVRMLCEQLDMPHDFGDSPQNMTKFLMKQKTEDILNAGDIFKEWDVDPLVNYRPVLELPDDGAFLTADPKYLIVTGQYHKVPWMTGIVPNEGLRRGFLISFNYTLRDKFNDRFSSNFLDHLEIPEKARTFINEEAVLKFYFGKENQLNNETYKGFIDSITHKDYYHPHFESVRHFVRHSDPEKAPVYLYRFAYRGNWSFTQELVKDGYDYGVFHGDELTYLFRSPALFDEENREQFAGYGSSDLRVMAEMVNMFTDFAKTGHPSPQLEQRPCDSRIFEFRNTICDYWDISNLGTAYDLRVRSDFNMDAVLFWGTVVHLFDWCFY